MEGAEVVVFAAWSADARRVKDVAEIGVLQAARAAKEAGAERFILLGPTGASADATSVGGRAHHAARQQVEDRAPPAVCLGLPVVFGQGDALISPWLSALSAGKAPRIAGANSWVQPLWIQDATRAVRRVMIGEHDGEFLELLGPERWRVSALAREICTREGQKPSRVPRRMSAEVEALLRDQQTAPDDWDRLHLGNRRTVNQWLSNPEGG
jgi:nucleoside-diphosphate-sugar epimerase